MKEHGISLKKDMVNFGDKTFDIQKASEVCGVSAHTIRAWEKRYQAVQPLRSDTGKRIYNESEVDRLRTLSLLVNLGTSIGQIAHLPDSDLQPMLEKLSSTKARYHSPKNSNWQFSHETMLARLMANLQDFDMDSLSHEMMEAHQGLNARDFVFKLLLPLITETKNRFKQGLLKQSQFQALFSVIRFYATAAIIPLNEKASRKKFYIASVEGTDSFAPITTALLCSHYEKKFFYSHISLPVEWMVETAVALETNVIILHFETQLEQSHLEKLLDALPTHLQIWVGTPYPASLTRKNVQFYQNFEQLELLLQQDPS